MIWTSYYSIILIFTPHSIHSESESSLEWSEGRVHKADGCSWPGPDVQQLLRSQPVQALPSLYTEIVISCTTRRFLQDVPDHSLSPNCLFFIRICRSACVNISNDFSNAPMRSASADFRQQLPTCVSLPSPRCLPIEARLLRPGVPHHVHSALVAVDTGL